MAYDPFRRGPHPAGVRTATVTDGDRDGRRLPIELWYPAAAAHAGADLDPATQDAYELVPGLPATRQEAVRDAAAAPGTFPVIAFSHGYGGHRRQSTFLCSHLASHGYVVVGIDHTGNTIFDILQMTLAVRRGGPLPD